VDVDKFYRQMKAAPLPSAGDGASAYMTNNLFQIIRIKTGRQTAAISSRRRNILVSHLAKLPHVRRLAELKRPQLLT
jgi:hypothetical protein